MSVRGSPAAAAAAGDEGGETAEELLARVSRMVPAAVGATTTAVGFPGRWKAIAAKLNTLPARLSDLSSHPCFARNALCRELLQSMAATLADATELAARPPVAGKLQMQSTIDALGARLDVNLRDCTLLVRTGVLSDASSAASTTTTTATPAAAQTDVRELLARLQIGQSEAKGRAVDGLLDALNRDEKSVVSALGRANVAALVQLLTAPAPAVREKAATVICQLAESGGGVCEALLVSEGAVPPLIRLAESGSSFVGREKAVLTLHRLSMSPDVAHVIAANGGARPLIEICETGDSVSQSAAAGTLKNLSAVPEAVHALAEEGIVRVMVNLLDYGTVLGSKEHAADCLQNLTSSSDSFRLAVATEGGLRSLLLYLDAPSPQESAVRALGNIVCAVSPDTLVSLGVLPLLAQVLRVGSTGAQQAAASAVCKISGSGERDMKRLIGEHGCVPLLVRMLDAKSASAREVTAQALASLMQGSPANAREVRRDERSVPSLVQLLDPSPANTAKKYAIACLLSLSSSKRCKKLMISHGAIGYLKKLTDMEVTGMEVTGAGDLLERLEERGKLRSIFSKN